MRELFTQTCDWGWVPEIPARTPGFYLFRNTFEVPDSGCELRINVSADNRYSLFLDGEVIGRGPCRNEVGYYNYETYTVPVSKGKHTLSAEVVVYAYGTRTKEGPIPEMHADSGFLAGGGIFSGNSKTIDLSTRGTWKGAVDNSRKHRSGKADNPIGSFYAIADMEEVDFSKTPGTWKKTDFDDSAWQDLEWVGEVRFRDEMTDSLSRWWLMPREIPHMDEKPEKIRSVVKTEGIEKDTVEKAFDTEFTPFTVPAGTSASITLDVGHLTTSFVNIALEGGRGGSLKCTYAESLWLHGDRLLKALEKNPVPEYTELLKLQKDLSYKKLERNHPDGEVFGYSDLLFLDSGKQEFETFWFRTLRFCRLDITAAEEDITVTDFSLRDFMYPFDLKGEFTSDDKETSQIWDIAWRTARLCAHEHYYDCPYYEQLQYVGDTRIQALISYAVTGDGRLGKQAVEQFDRSRIPEGLTQSRYPSSWMQIIGGFSLYWTMMVHDYYTWYGDLDFVKNMLPGVQGVLDWFERNRLASGILGHCNFWNFCDWVQGWLGGNPARGEKLPITLHSLVYAEACRMTAELYEAVNETGKAEECTLRYTKTIKAVKSECYDPEKKLFTDVPGKPWFSQQTNAWAIISETVTGEEAGVLSEQIIVNKELSQATLYFTFYLFRAWEKVGHYDLFWKALEKWESVLKYDFTTFPEIPNPGSRSDCHAWSSSPMYEFTTRVLGIRPGSPGCSSIILHPHPGPLSHAEGKACMNDQVISVKWNIENNEMKLDVECEKETPVTIIWPDGSEQDAGKILSGSFSSAL